MNSPDAREEVARRVRRAVGFKVMRDTHKLAEQMQREDRQRPRLLLKLLVLVALLAVLAVVVWRVL